MPRELMHWEVLERTAERVKAEGAGIVSDLLTEYRDLALLGAVAHDAPYYYRAGGSAFEKVANGLHGLSGQDTFHPLRLLATEISTSQDIEFRRAAWGFLLGMMTHALADQWMHPWIFYFTGDYYHPDPAERLEARRRHRLLEVYLDGWVALREDRRAPHSSLLSILNRIPAQILDPITALLGDVLTRSLFFPEEAKHDTTAEWRLALRHQAKLQWVFTHQLTGALFDLAARFGGPALKSIEALSNYNRVPLGSLLGGQHHFKNPATGAEIYASIDELLESTVDECARLFIALDAEINSSASPAILRLYRGVSLNYGAWGVGPGEAGYYSDTGLPLPGLELIPTSNLK